MSGLLAVDPGIRGTGLALFNRGELYPVKTRTITPDPSQLWQNRAQSLVTDYESFLLTNKPTEVYLELPVFFIGSQRGIKTARNGDLVKLAMLAGMLYWVSLAYGADVNAIEPSVWKGRKSKEDSHTLIRRILPHLPEKVSGHAMDAVGIGLYAKKYIYQGIRKVRP